MRCILILLALLTWTVGCVVEDRPVNPNDGGADGGLCPPCEGETPVCDEDTRMCVECSVEQQAGLCDGATPFCSPDGECVACVDDTACRAVNAAKCDDELYECVMCDDDRQCDDAEGFPGTANACDTVRGLCVDCTPESEATSCPGDPAWFVCDPNTNTCTDIPAGSRLVCETCFFDSECGDDEGMPSEDYRCVPMYHPTMDTRFPDEETGFCLKTTDGGCERPYAVPLSNRQSFSEGPPADYCGVNETLTTCPAVRALLADDRCDGGTDDECQEGGICRQVGPLMNRCTYLCGLPAQCPEEPPADTCGASGSGSDDYCGG